MRFTLTIPPAGSLKIGKQAYFVIPRGTELHRIHRDIFGSTQFNGTDKGEARFSPITDVAGAIVPTIYAAETFDCATCEIILRCPDAPPPASALGVRQIVFPTDFADRMHSVVRTTSDLKLVNITTAGQRLIGVDHSLLLAGPTSTYPATRAWAAQIHAKCPDAHGLYYHSHQYGPKFAIVLFGDRVPGAALVPISQRSVADPVCHDAIAALADSLSIEYEDV